MTKQPTLVITHFLHAITPGNHVQGQTHFLPLSRSWCLSSESLFRVQVFSIASHSESCDLFIQWTRVCSAMFSPTWIPCLARDSHPPRPRLPPVEVNSHLLKTQTGEYSWFTANTGPSVCKTETGTHMAMWRGNRAETGNQPKWIDSAHVGPHTDTLWPMTFVHEALALGWQRHPEVWKGECQGVATS